MAMAMAMASASCLHPLAASFPPSLLPLLPPLPRPFRQSFAFAKTVPPFLALRAATEPLGGDFGARDPFPAELESNFGNKVLGNASTEHVILIPNSAVLGLADKSCKPLPPGQAPLLLEEAKALLRKIVGWRLVEGEGALRLQCEWKLKDCAAGKELLNRISVVANAEGHHPELHLDEPTNKVMAELWTHSIGGLSQNDFILAAKIDRIDTSDLIKRNRFWA